MRIPVYMRIYTGVSIHVYGAQDPFRKMLHVFGESVCACVCV